MKYAPRFLLLGISSLCLSTISFRALADDITAFPLTPRISGLGMGGTDEVVSGDGMAALLGNENGIWLLDAQGKTAFESSYVGSLGTGFRMVQGDQRILGAYVFGDANVSPDNNQYWFVSPGIESMGTLMDFRMNGYIPVGTQRNLTSTGFADDFGNYNYVTFTGHDQLDAIVNNFEEVGWGLDGEAGIRLARLQGVRLYAGGYHFNLQNADDINGFSGRLQVPINSYIEFNVRDSYDNDQHNTIEIGLRFTLGGVNKSPRDPNQPIRERLLDPIERNLATLGQGTAEPVVNEQEVVNPNNPLVLERDNIWFFSPSGTDMFANSSSCTAENPCVNTNFTQATIDSINAHPDSPVIVDSTPSADPSFYLAPGQYSTLTMNGMTVTPYTFTNDLVYGRSADFTMPQQSAFLNGAVILNGNDTFDSVIFHNDPGFTQAVGLTLNTGSSLILTNSIVGTDESTQGYLTAITMDDATLNGTNSQIHAYSNTPDMAAIGINTIGSAGSTINLTNSSVQATNNILNISSVNFLAAEGIALDDTAGSTVSLTGSVVNASANSTADLTGLSVTVGGIYVGPENTTGTETINLSKSSTINASGDFTSGNATIMGIGNDLLNSPTAPVINVSLNNSTINSTITGNGGVNDEADGIALNTGTSSQVTLTNSAINATSDSSFSTGVVTVNGIEEIGAPSQSVTLTDSQVSVSDMGVNTNDFITGINVMSTGSNSQANVTEQGGSSITANIPNSEDSGFTDVYGINTAADMTNVNVNNSDITASATIPDNIVSNDMLQVEGIRDTSAVSDVISVTNGSTINASATVGASRIFKAEVDGINELSTGSPTGTVTVNNSDVNADMAMGTSEVVSAEVNGIQGADNSEDISLDKANIDVSTAMTSNDTQMSLDEYDIAILPTSAATISVADSSNLTAEFEVGSADANFLDLEVGNILAVTGGSLLAPIPITVTDSNLSINAEVLGDPSSQLELITNNIFVQGTSVDINIEQNSSLSNLSEIDLSGPSFDSINATNIQVSSNTGANTINVDSSTLGVTAQFGDVTAFNNSVEASAQNIVALSGPETITINNSTLSATASMGTVHSGDGISLTAQNINAQDGTGGDNNITVQNSTLNATGTFGSLLAPVTNVTMDIENINASNTVGSSNITASNSSFFRTGSITANANPANCTATLTGVNVSTGSASITVPAGTYNSSPPSAATCSTITNTDQIP